MLHAVYYKNEKSGLATRDYNLFAPPRLQFSENLLECYYYSSTQCEVQTLTSRRKQFLHDLIAHFSITYVLY